MSSQFSFRVLLVKEILRCNHKWFFSKVLSFFFLSLSLFVVTLIVGVDVVSVVSVQKLQDSFVSHIALLVLVWMRMG